MCRLKTRILLIWSSMCFGVTFAIKLSIGSLSSQSVFAMVMVWVVGCILINNVK